MIRPLINHSIQNPINFSIKHLGKFVKNPIDSYINSRDNHANKKQQLENKHRASPLNLLTMYKLIILQLKIVYNCAYTRKGSN